MKLLARVGAALVCAAALVGCAEVGPSVGSDDAATTAIPSLSAAYSVVLDSFTTVRKIDSGDVVEHHTRVLALADVDQQGAMVALQIYPCRLRLPEVSGMLPRVADDVVQTLEPLSMFGALIVGHDGAPTRFESDKGVLLMGVRDFDDPFNDPMPTHKRDPRVFDQDEDNAPGISVHLPLIRVFSAVRAVVSLTGDASSDGRVLAGDAQMTLDAEVLGDSNLFIDAQANAAEAEGNSELLAQHHNFEMVALAKTDASCSRVIDLVD